VDLVRQGPIDYLTLDYLAEITMSIMQKQRARDPRTGYARDFVDVITRVLPAIVDGGLRVVANAGGVNPEACAEAVLDVARRAGKAIRVAIVTGDDIYATLDELTARGHELRNLDTGEPLSTIRSQVVSANVYFGAFPIAEALGKGAQVVITGRSTDPSLVLGPMIHEFGWRATDYDKLAAGTIAGHTVECGAQCTGGNCQADWETIPDLAGVGYPIVEASEDGTFVVTKHEGTGGRVSVASISEQLLYELGDPAAYITPDCIADFRSIRLSEDGENRVRFAGIRGQAPTDRYKVSISYSWGFKATGMLAYSWPDAYEKAQAADRILRARLERLGLRFDAIRTEFLGVNGCHESLAGPPAAELAEVCLRVGVRSRERAPVERFTKEIAPLALNGPPVVTGMGAGRPKVEEVVAYWPALLEKSEAGAVVKVRAVE
jgi:hypothetical protein